jgi:hypothetical protein
MEVLKKSGWLALLFCVVACGKKSGGNPDPVVPIVPFKLTAVALNGRAPAAQNHAVSVSPVLNFSFDGKLNRNSFSAAFSWKDDRGNNIPYTINFANGDSTATVQPATPLPYLSRYSVAVTTSAQSVQNVSIPAGTSFTIITALDSADKFPRITDSALIEKVQQQTFKYFWEGAHPVSGLARERANSGDIVTTGGSGFGIMAIITAMHRGFISKAQGLARLQTITDFLHTKAQKFHGAFPHWLNGATGAVVPFSTKDNGADLVETSYLIQGLLCARQYFNGADAAEAALRTTINAIWQNVEWDWFKKGGENVLYWHWSPNYGWDMNLQIRGWNEALVVYALAAASPVHAVPKTVYDGGWASNGTMKNGSVYYGYTLPLGPPLGGPLFFEHYSFLGINPFGLVDAYADYKTQVTNHTKINHEYCRANPKGWYGYSDACWGLTASDVPNGYTASSPTNDVGVIAPTAALSSLPYTPAESMKALQFFYYKLGDKLWGEYGFKDAFSLHEAWFADSYLAIDQGPIIVMLENYRSGLLWSLFMSCPEVKTGMKNLGFTSPYL